jgi:hypothetical protein
MPGSPRLGRYAATPPADDDAANAGPPPSTLDAAVTALTHAVRHCLRRNTLICERYLLDGKPTLRLTLAGPLPNGWKTDWLVAGLIGVGIAVDGAAGPSAEQPAAAREGDTRR